MLTYFTVGKKRKSHNKVFARFQNLHKGSWLRNSSIPSGKQARTVPYPLQSYIAGLAPQIMGIIA